jgi:hypothetical protein
MCGYYATWGEKLSATTKINRALYKVSLTDGIS